MPRILFAEDGVTVMNLGGVLFDNPDIDLDVVTDGRSALDRIARAPSGYDLVILGYDLPEINGPDCVAFLRKMFRRLPILLLSETVDEVRLNELARLGIRRSHILQKPTAPQTFAVWVDNALKEIPP